MIVISAPTGDIGQQVVQRLLAAGEQVRVIVRDPSKLSEQVRERVEVVTGSHGEAAVVERAFAGADAVFWLVPPNPKAESLDAAYVEFTRPAAEAFKTHQIKRVVGVSALGRGVPGSAGYVTASLATDDLIAATGVNYRALTMPSFMDNMLRNVESIKNQGTFFGPLPGDLKLPTCATRDIAEVAAGLLVDDSWTGFGEVPVLGPEDLSQDDQARTLSDVLGKEVRYQQIPLQALKDRLTGFGMTDAMAQGMVDMMDAKSKGLDKAQPRTPEATTPTTFRRWSEEVLKPAAEA